MVRCRPIGLPADGLDLHFSPDLVIATTTRALTGTAAMPDHYVLIGAALLNAAGSDI
jgi:hypothetical protein